MSDKITVQVELSNSTSLSRSILRLPDVIRLTGYKRAAIYRMIKKGKFPNSRKIGPRAVGWNSEEIQKWIDERLG